MSSQRDMPSTASDRGPEPEADPVEGATTPVAPVAPDRPLASDRPVAARGAGEAGFQRGRIQWGRMPASDFLVGPLPASSNRLRDAVAPVPLGSRTRSAPARPAAAPASGYSEPMASRPTVTPTTLQRPAGAGFFSGSMIPRAAPTPTVGPVVKDQGLTQSQIQTQTRALDQTPERARSPLPQSVVPESVVPGSVVSGSLVPEVTRPATPLAQISPVEARGDTGPSAGSQDAIGDWSSTAPPAARPARSAKPSRTPLYAGVAVVAVAAAAAAAWALWSRSPTPPASESAAPQNPGPESAEPRIAGPVASSPLTPPQIAPPAVSVETETTRVPVSTVTRPVAVSPAPPVQGQAGRVPSIQAQTVRPTTPAARPPAPGAVPTQARPYTSSAGSLAVGSPAVGSPRAVTPPAIIVQPLEAAPVVPPPTAARQVPVDPDAPVATRPQPLN
ncbi:hypothetical protein BH10PSE2_BH10PSE2_17410 [soil metagenome]